MTIKRNLSSSGASSVISSIQSVARSEATSPKLKGFDYAAPEISNEWIVCRIDIDPVDAWFEFRAGVAGTGASNRQAGNFSAADRFNKARRRFAAGAGFYRLLFCRAVRTL